MPGTHQHSSLSESNQRPEPMLEAKDEQQHQGGEGRMVQFAFPHEVLLNLKALSSILQYSTMFDSLALSAYRFRILSLIN
jgi:hypothetical protein